MNKQRTKSHSFQKLCCNHAPSQWTTVLCQHAEHPQALVMKSLEQCVNEIMTDDTCDRPVCLSVCPDRMTDLTEGLVGCRGRNGLWVGRGGIQVFPTDIMTAFQCVTSSHECCGLPSYSSIQIPTPAKQSSLPHLFFLSLCSYCCICNYTKILGHPQFWHNF